MACGGTSYTGLDVDIATDTDMLTFTLPTDEVSLDDFIYCTTN